MSIHQLICKLLASSKHEKEVANEDSSTPLNKEQLRPIKRMLQQSPESSSLEAYRSLIDHFKKKSKKVRDGALLIFNYIFSRSPKFRSVANENIRDIFDILAVHDSKAKRSDFRSDTEFLKSIRRSIELWDFQYGSECPQIRATARCIRESSMATTIIACSDSSSILV
jgi:hypothetical protein